MIRVLKTMCNFYIIHAATTEIFYFMWNETWRKAAAVSRSINHKFQVSKFNLSSYKNLHGSPNLRILIWNIHFHFRFPSETENFCVDVSKFQFTLSSFVERSLVRIWKILLKIIFLISMTRHKLSTPPAMALNSSPLLLIVCTLHNYELSFIKQEEEWEREKRNTLVNLQRGQIATIKSN